MASLMEIEASPEMVNSATERKMNHFMVNKLYGNEIVGNKQLIRG